MGKSAPGGVCHTLLCRLRNLIGKQFARIYPDRRARLQPVRQIHVRSPRSQSPPCLSSSGTRTARSQARTSATHCSGESTISLFSRESSADMLLIMIFVHNMLMQTICFTKAHRRLHVHLLGGRQAEHRPLSEGKKRRGGLPIPESGRWI